MTSTMPSAEAKLTWVWNRTAAVPMVTARLSELITECATTSSMSSTASESLGEAPGGSRSLSPLQMSRMWAWAKGILRAHRRAGVPVVRKETSGAEQREPDRVGVAPEGVNAAHPVDADGQRQNDSETNHVLVEEERCAVQPAALALRKPAAAGQTPGWRRCAQRR